MKHEIRSMEPETTDPLISTTCPPPPPSPPPTAAEFFDMARRCQGQLARVAELFGTALFERANLGRILDPTAQVMPEFDALTFQLQRMVSIQKSLLANHDYIQRLSADDHSDPSGPSDPSTPCTSSASSTPSISSISSIASTPCPASDTSAPVDSEPSASPALSLAQSANADSCACSNAMAQTPSSNPANPVNPPNPVDPVNPGDPGDPVSFPIPAPWPRFAGPSLHPSSSFLPHQFRPRSATYAGRTSVPAVRSVHSVHTVHAVRACPPIPLNEIDSILDAIVPELQSLGLNVPDDPKPPATPPGSAGVPPASLANLQSSIVNRQSSIAPSPQPILMPRAPACTFLRSVQARRQLSRERIPFAIRLSLFAILPSRAPP
jgi:hypothetical protein